MYFRISEDEFRQLTHLCESHGARNISELARTAMKSLILGNGDGPHPNREVAQKLTKLDEALTELNEHLKKIALSPGDGRGGS